MGALEGMIIKPLCMIAAEMDPSIVINALLISLCIFATMSVVALKAKSRSMLFLGGILSSLMMYIAIASIFSFFTGFAFLSSMQYNLLFAGIFSLFVIYDTQLILERFRLGDKNHMAHSLTLFLDLVQIFIKILRILMENASKNKKKD